MWFRLNLHSFVSVNNILVLLYNIQFSCAHVYSNSFQLSISSTFLTLNFFAFTQHFQNHSNKKKTDSLDVNINIFELKFTHVHNHSRIYHIHEIMIVLPFPMYLYCHSSKFEKFMNVFRVNNWWGTCTQGRRIRLLETWKKKTKISEISV